METGAGGQWLGNNDDGAHLISGQGAEVHVRCFISWVRTSRRYLRTLKAANALRTLAPGTGGAVLGTYLVFVAQQPSCVTAMFLARYFGALPFSLQQGWCGSCGTNGRSTFYCGTILWSLGTLFDRPP